MTASDGRPATGRLDRAVYRVAGVVVLRAAGPHRVGRVMSVLGVPMLLGPISGPILGGC